MSIRMIGIDHSLAPVDVREKFSFTRKAATESFSLLKDELEAEGVIILSTCNRMEIYVSTAFEQKEPLLPVLARLKGLAAEDYTDCFIERSDEEAVDHLFHLTCGLKSQILAEDQIITQVKDALNLSRDNYYTDGVLEVLFRKAVTAAKRVKTEVTFSRANETAMDRAVEMLRKQGVDLQDQPCLVIGNGEMGKLAAQTLKAAGCDVTVTVRQYRSGIVAIPRGCRRIDYGERMSLLPKCSIVVSATASPNYTIRQELMDEIEINHPITMIDLAVPRDIEKSIGDMDDIDLYDIDDFKSSEDECNADAYAQAGRILREYEEEFYEWVNERDVIPRIQNIQQVAATDLDLRLKKILRKLPMEDDKREALSSDIHAAAGRVIGKIIYGLKDSLKEEEFQHCIENLEDLYHGE